MRTISNSAVRAAAGAALAATVVAATLAASGAAQAQDPYAPSHTHHVVVRPVDDTGHAEPGWKVHREKDLTVQCDGTSAAAVNDGIYSCFPAAAYLPACWPSTHHTVLCLRDARHKNLVRLRYTGSFHAGTAPARSRTRRSRPSAGGWARRPRLRRPGRRSARPTAG